MALGHSLPEFLLVGRETCALAKFITEHQSPDAADNQVNRGVSEPITHESISKIHKISRNLQTVFMRYFPFAPMLQWLDYPIG